MSNNDIQEQQILEFLNLLNSGLASEECSTAAMPFMCQYVYPPCDDDGNPLLVTQEQCANIRDDVCTNEWILIMNTELRSLLPVCEEFREDNTSSSIETMRNVSEPLNCHYQFDEYCGVCLPLCGEFSQYRVQTKLATRSLIIFSAIIELIGGSIFLIASILRRKEMLVYPQVLEVCHVISAMILAAFVLIGYVGGQERLFCSHRTLHLSFQEPSLFAKIIGFVIQFCFLFMATTWFFYVFHLFLGLAFPFWSARLFSEETRKLKICIMEIFGAFTFSGIFPTIVLSVSDFRIARFPPVIVIPSKDLILYTFLLPIAILLIVGVNLMFLSFWIIHKTKGIFNKEKEKSFFKINFSVPQVKILLLLSYTVIFSSMAFATLTVLADNSDDLINDVFRYSACNLFGYNPKCEDIRNDFERHTSPGLINSTILLLGFLSWINLLYVIQVRHIQRAAKWIKACRVFLSSRINGSWNYCADN
ncbi:uncharacterized protein [Dysidea avara]